MDVSSVSRLFGAVPGPGPELAVGVTRPRRLFVKSRGGRDPGPTSAGARLYAVKIVDELTTLVRTAHADPWEPEGAHASHTEAAGRACAARG
jgi:hypothetical protein